MASTVQWFSNTANIKRAVLLLNDIDDKKALRLLIRVAQNLHKKNEKAFTDEEEEKLCSAFNLTSRDVENILDTISFVLEQAAYHSAKLNTLRKQLAGIGFTEEKVECFAKVWEENGSFIVEQYRKRTFAPKQLDTVNWELRLQTAQSNKTKMKMPSAIIELGLLSPDSKDTEKVLYEFNHAQLFELFTKLETVQKQLDGLNKN